MDILQDSEPSTDFSSETTVLVLALHCLVLVRTFSIIDNEECPIPENDDFCRQSPFIFRESDYEENIILLCVIASRHEGTWLPGENQPPGYPHDGSLGAILDYIVYLAFNF